MQLELITADSFPESLREDWNRLADGDPLASYEWHSAWWRHFGGRRFLLIGVARQNGRIVGLASAFTARGPLRGRKLLWTGSGKACTDYQRILVDPTYTVVQAEQVIESLAGCLMGGAELRRKQDLWDLDGMQPDAPSTTALVHALRKQHFTIHAEPLESCWVTELPNTWPAFVGQVHRSLRRKIAKAERRAADGEARYGRATTPTEVAAFWNEFVRLHQARFEGRVRDGGCFSDPTFTAFLRDAVLQLAARGAVRLVWCEVDGKPISTQLYLLGNGTASMYQSGFDPEASKLEPGHLLYTRVVRELIEEGYRKLDFLRGDESYKTDWNGKPTPLVRLFCIPPRRSSQLRHRTYRFARSVKRAAMEKWTARLTDADLPATAPSSNELDHKSE